MTNKTIQGRAYIYAGIDKIGNEDIERYQLIIGNSLLGGTYAPSHMSRPDFFKVTARSFAIEIASHRKDLRIGYVNGYLFDVPQSGKEATPIASRRKVGSIDEMTLSFFSNLVLENLAEVSKGILEVSKTEVSEGKKDGTNNSL